MQCPMNKKKEGKEEQNITMNIPCLPIHRPYRSTPSKPSFPKVLE